MAVQLCKVCGFKSLLYVEHVGVSFVQLLAIWLVFPRVNRAAAVIARDVINWKPDSQVASEDFQGDGCCFPDGLIVPQL